MKKKLAALLGVIAVVASSFAFMGTPTAGAMLTNGDSGCYYTYGWAIVNGVAYPILIRHC